MVESILLAGTPKHKSRLINGENKFFAEINGHSLGNTVIDALAQSREIESILIIGNKPELERHVSNPKVSKIIAEKGDFYTNAMEALRFTRDHAHPDKQVLFIACDIPFIHSKALDDFITHAPKADFIYPYCIREDFEWLFPRFQWPYQVYREGDLKFGNMALVKPNRVMNKALIGRLFGLRKVAVSDHRVEEFENIPRVIIEAFKLRGAEGIEIAVREIFLKYLAKPLGLKTQAAQHLSIKRVTDMFSTLLKCAVISVPTRFPELCYDIDNETKELRYTKENFQAIMDRIQSR